MDEWQPRAVERHRLIFEDGQWRASIYSDGDVAVNGPGTHIEVLRLGVLISRLQSLKALAEANFGENWGRD